MMVRCREGQLRRQATRAEHRLHPKLGAPVSLIDEHLRESFDEAVAEAKRNAVLSAVGAVIFALLGGDLGRER